MAGVIGQFNKRVTFQSYETSADGAGGNSENRRAPTIILSTWARVTDRGSSRSLNEYVDTVEKRKDIDVFYRSALSSLPKNTFILYNGDEYTIESSENLEEKKRIIRYKAVAAT